MKTRVKGSRARRKAMDNLITIGYLVDVVEKTGRFIKIKDLFGLFDILAIHETYRPMLIQVTCNTPHTHYKYQEFSSKYGNHFDILQMVWVDRKGFRVWKYMNTGEKTEVKL